MRRTRRRRLGLRGVLGGVTLLVIVVAIAWAVSSALQEVATPPHVPRPAQWRPDELTIAYVGHASMLIGMQGTMILTDPAFFERIGVTVAGVTLGPKRIVGAALQPADLPPLDAVVVSHAHMDSLDRPSLARLTAAPLLVVPPRTRDLVDDLGFARVVELGWGEQVDAGELRIEAFEVAHWGARWPWEEWRGYNGYFFRKGETEVLFAPDTAYTRRLGAAAAGRRLVAAIIGNGAYDPWIMNHADPEQVWTMFRESGACWLAPCHWDTFRLGKEPLGEAMARLRRAAGADADRIVIDEIGATWSAPARNADCP